MAVQFTCPHCGAQTSVADEFIGHSGPCAQCGNVVTIPAPGGVAPVYAPPTAHSRGPSIALILAIVVGVLLLVVGGLVALLLPAVGAARESARRSSCQNNLRQIGLGMLNHESAMKRFPAPDGVGPGGQKVSWRVQMLPYIENGALYDAYNREEPWDSPANLAWAETMPPEYRCPSESNAGPMETNYVAIVGPQTAMPSGGGIGVRQITDGLGNTILHVEVSSNGITWSEPRDLDAATLSYQIDDPSGRGLSGPHSGGVNAVFCDGSVQFLSDSMDPEVLRALVTRAGNEDLPYDVFD